jgi:hypothetical protein
MAQIWYKNNKAAEKWTEKEVVSIFEDTYNWIKKKKGLVLMGEVELYMLETHSVSKQLRGEWINNIHKNNKSILQLFDYISQITENKLVRDTKELRPSIQGMVLQNKHNYRERKEEKVEATMTVKHEDLAERLKNIDGTNKQASINKSL